MAIELPKMKNHLLIGSLVKSLPKAFVVDLLKGVDWAYSEAHTSAIKNINFGEAEQIYIEPHFRRCLLERKLQDIAGAHSLVTKIVTVASNKYQYTNLEAGNFVLTLSHTKNPDKIVRNSSFRNSAAALNQVLDQMDLFEDKAAIPKDTALNAVIYHGTDFRDPYHAGFLKIGFPEAGNQEWAHSMDFYDLLEFYSTVTTEEDKDLVIQWKKKSGEIAS